MRKLLLALLAALPFFSSAQGVLTPREDDGYHCPAIVVDGDTIPVLYYDDVTISGTRIAYNSTESRDWQRLVRNVKKAYPYAKIAGQKFNEYNNQIALLKTENERKELMKKAEDDIQAQFGEELKDLTFSQGKILIKLIDRQTRNTSFDIVKDYRGKFRAFFYQSFARLFGYNLKEHYDPLGQDADIERIVLMIENGTI
jgi:hypothetical protein